jgi:CheY-like chemotaxis protein
MDKRICFLIDDDEDDREIFSLALETVDSSFGCSTAKNGLEAIKQLQSSAIIPHIIFIDLNMPYMSGKECLIAIREMKQLADVPIIMYTTSSYRKDAEDTQALGASHFLVKPSSIGALTSVLSDIIQGEELPYFLDTAKA